MDRCNRGLVIASDLEKCFRPLNPKVLRCKLWVHGPDIRPGLATVHANHSHLWQGSGSAKSAIEVCMGNLKKVSQSS